ncbi:hypothetical protein E3O45_05965 [Cryobacterium sp. TMS1-20-1]|uniref:hypothetical protein n=1 Tax=Cryobacterium sp. TMS1-20-1 TaxID=1259223 RepID=UPI00106BC399|nr:hypothetical protein [Cryobacterium sp. TMS1-20-1]TFC78158.1 hypothetical protein E3O45_05965 [Cryobacterium sp. TMS1-20-1]
MSPSSTLERCSNHDAGDAFQTRCVDCDSSVAGGDAIDRQETARLGAVIGRTGYIPGSECDLHPNYPLLSRNPLLCDSCERDLAGIGLDDRGAASVATATLSNHAEVLDTLAQEIPNTKEK